MSIIANIVPMQVIVQPLPEPQIIVENGVVVAIVEQELIIVAVAEQGPAGAALTFEDLTPEQKDELKGPAGKDLTLEDFSVSPEASTLNDTDRFLIEQGGVWKKITKENLQKQLSSDHVFTKNLGRMGVSSASSWASADANYGFANYSYGTSISGVSDTSLVQSLPELLVAPFKMRIKEILLTGINSGVYNFGLQLNIQKWNRNLQNNQATILNQSPITQLNPNVFYKLIDKQIGNGLEDVIIEKGESIHFIWKSNTAGMYITSPNIYFLYEKIN